MSAERRTSPAPTPLENVPTFRTNRVSARPLHFRSREEAIVNLGEQVTLVREKEDWQVAALINAPLVDFLLFEKHRREGFRTR